MRPFLIYLAATALLSLSTLAADSPIGKGSVVLGGGFGFSSIGGDLVGDESLSLVSLGPTVGTFISRGNYLGISIAYQHLSWEDISLSLIGFGPTMRLYFAPQNARAEAKGSVYPYVQVRALYDRVTAEESGYWGDDKVTADGFQFGGGLGVVVMMSNEIGLDMGFGYDHLSLSVEDFESESGSITHFGLGIKAFLW